MSHSQSWVYICIKEELMAERRSSSSLEGTCFLTSWHRKQICSLTLPWRWQGCGLVSGSWLLWLVPWRGTVVDPRLTGSLQTPVIPCLPGVIGEGLTELNQRERLILAFCLTGLRTKKDDDFIVELCTRYSLMYFFFFFLNTRGIKMRHLPHSLLISMWIGIYWIRE